MDQYNALSRYNSEHMWWKTAKKVEDYYNDWIHDRGAVFLNGKDERKIPVEKLARMVRDIFMVSCYTPGEWGNRHLEMDILQKAHRLCPWPVGAPCKPIIRSSRKNNILISRMATDKELQILRNFLLSRYETLRVKIWAFLPGFII